MLKKIKIIVFKKFCQFTFLELDGPTLDQLRVLLSHRVTEIQLRTLLARLHPLYPHILQSATLSGNVVRTELGTGGSRDNSLNYKHASVFSITNGFKFKFLTLESLQSGFSKVFLPHSKYIIVKLCKENIHFIYFLKIRSNLVSDSF